MEKKIMVTEDQALAQNVPLSTLVQAKEDEGYVVTSMYGHPAVGTVVVMDHRNFMDKPLTHRDFLEKGKRGW
jgi:hypothetical protein